MENSLLILPPPMEFVKGILYPCIYSSLPCRLILTALFEKAELEEDLKLPSCGTTSVSHIIFADDLLVFLQVDKQNACRLKSILEEFSTLSGLSINLQKSTVYFGGQVKHRRWITSHLGLSSGELPKRYLGLLLLSKRLSATECEPLTQAITSHLQSWKVRFLSYAGRVELIRSVLSSMHLYWTSVFVLPASVLHAIDRLLLHFLWYGYGLES